MKTSKLSLLGFAATGLFSTLAAHAYYDPGVGRFASRDPISERGGANLYVIVVNEPISKWDFLGLKPDTQCRLNGQPVSLIFDGLTLSGSGFGVPAASGVPVAQTNTGSWTFQDPYRMTIVSGYYLTKTFDYSPARQGVRNAGPIPSGRYWFDSCEERSFWTSPIQHGVGSGSWGSYSWSLHPDAGTDTRGRSGFFIHGGTTWGSAGCIDLRYGDTQLHNLMERVRRGLPRGCCCYVVVAVNYAVSQATQTDTVTTSIVLPVY